MRDMLVTDRLGIRRMSADDADFMLRLLNDPSWIRNIGDRGVRTVIEARAYILAGPATSGRPGCSKNWALRFERVMRHPDGTRDLHLFAIDLRKHPA